MKYLKYILPACVLIAASTVAQATLNSYESFDYSASSALNSQNGGSGFSSAWSGPATGATITAPGSDYSTLEVAGNKVLLTPSAGNIFEFRDLNTSYTSGTVYISFLAQNTNSGQRFFGLSLFDNSSEQLLIGKSSGTSAFFDDWGLAQGATINNSSVDSTTLSLLVARIDFNAVGNETIRLYVNPTLGVEPGSANATLTTVGITGFNRIRLGAGYFNGSASTIEGTIDEVRIGSTYADVTPVPETSTYALLMALVLIGYSIRRRLSA